MLRNDCWRCQLEIKQGNIFGCDVARGDKDLKGTLETSWGRRLKKRNCLDKREIPLPNKLSAQAFAYVHLIDIFDFYPDPEGVNYIFNPESSFESLSV